MPRLGWVYDEYKSPDVYNAIYRLAAISVKIISKINKELPAL